MITIKNKLFPLGRFKAMAIWPFVFVRSDKNYTNIDVQHEDIHGRQQLELLIVVFWALYIVFAIIAFFRCLLNKSLKQKPATEKQRTIWQRIDRVIIFEREAYACQNINNYLRKRRWMAWIKY